MDTTTLDYDSDTVVTMLAALTECPTDRRLDSLACVMKIFIEIPTAFDPCTSEEQASQ